MKETSNYAHFQKESTQGFSYITNITSSLLSWVCHEVDLATSLDNGARSPNTHIWSNKNEILTISRALTSSTYVPLLLRKQPIMEFSACVVNFYFVAFCEAQETCQKTEVCNPRVNSKLLCIWWKVMLCYKPEQRVSIFNLTSVRFC